MGVIAMILGVSGTGKTASLRNFKKDDIAFVNVTGKPLPFKGKFDETLVSDDYRKIKNFIKGTEKTSIILDDVQYLMGNEFMRRITEKGWERFNEIAFSFNDLLDFIAYELPENKIVYLFGHTEKDNDGNEKFKTMGKAIDSCICVEGKVFVVLKTSVTDGKYCFLTQNSGHDTTKSPIGMFPSYAIDNDLKYVDDKIRNYYEIGEYKSDAEMGQADQAASTELEKPDANGRRSRSRKTAKEEPEKASGTRKTRAEVEAENHQKTADYMTAVDEALDKAFPDQEEVPFEEAAAVADAVPKPDLQKPPRRTRKERQAEQEQGAETFICTEDTYFYIPADDNYVMKHQGDESPKEAKVITKEEFIEGCKRISQGKSEQNPVEGAMNPPETPARGQRRRRTR